MTQFDRRLFARSVTIGVILTLLTLIAQQLGGLSSLDDWFYDLRAALCQHFTPPPSNQIVHLDIDNASLETIGHWPWPQATLARILDEVEQAHPKVVALDILFGEAERATPASTQPADQEDPELAAAVGRRHNVLLAMSFQLATPLRRPVDTLAQDALFENLELTPAELSLKLSTAGLQLGTDDSINDLLLRSRRIAMRNRLQRELSLGPATREQLLARLLPHVDPSLNSPVLRLLDEELTTLNAARQLRQFALTAPPMPIAPVQGTWEVIPLRALSANAAGIGVVNYDIFSSATVRSAPMFAEFDRGLYPQMGLALGCAMRGTDVRRARIERGRIEIPCPDGSEISIPTHSYHSQTLRRDVSLIADIPWFGTSDWVTMYDWPAHRQAAQHISITQIWDVCQTQDRIAQQ